MLRRLTIGSVVGVVVLATMISTISLAAGAPGDQPVPVTPYSGFDASLTRAPYVTDLTQTSADVNWATTSGPAVGTLKYGPSGSCTATTLTVPSTLPSSFPAAGTPSSITARQFTVNGISEFQSTAVITGLTAGTTYCYRVFSSAALDLLGSNPSPTFTTLDTVGSSSAVTFDVVGDLGETNYSSGVDYAGSRNTNQAAIDSLIGSSGAKFAVTVGDVAYAGGTQANYGDLQQVGTQVSDIFGPSYWPQTGGIPTFNGVGNHGQNVDSLRVWPESNSAAASSGDSSFQSYPPVPADGLSNPSTEPAAWYAISTGNVRIYVLDAAWGDSNVGTSNLYQVDYDQHWTPSSPEYQWLAADLASHPGGVKMAVFHLPLRSDNSTQASDTNLQNSTANPNASSSLEALLANGGVSIAFNGHAHTYQRIIPRQAGQITNYVTGGGGGVLEPVDGGSTCTNFLASADVYALGWSPSGAGPISGSGSSCGPGTTPPQSAADVYNFLKVTVSGNTITVSPTNAAGKVFDQHSYTPTSNSATPSTPGNVTATATSSSSIQVNWNASTETGGTITSYAVTRSVNGGTYAPLTTLAAPTTGFTDTTVQPGAQYSYRVTASDNKSQTSAAGTSNKVATPTIPGNVTANATSGTSVQLNWDASNETGGTIGSYEVGRNGVQIATGVIGTAFTDTSAQPGTTYTYTVTAVDGIGAPSSPGTSNSVTTPGSLPFTGGGAGCMAHLPAGSVVGSAALNDGSGYYEVDSAGDVAAFGGAVCYGAMTGIRLNLPIVGIAVDPATGGYWLVATDGGVFSFNAPFLGSTGAIRLNKPIVGMSATLDGSGYWMVASDGGVFSFNAPFYGSTGNLRLNKPIVGMGLDRATGGYWMVATDGGVFSFNAPFYGSTGSIRLNQPIVGMAPLSNGGGYRLIASDGGVFDFNAPFYGSTGSIRLNRPMIAGVNDNAGDGYWMMASDGGVFSFNAPFLGSAA